jgi:hypothetical protein
MDVDDRKHSANHDDYSFAARSRAELSQLEANLMDMVGNTLRARLKRDYLRRCARHDREWFVGALAIW